MGSAVSIFFCFRDVDEVFQSHAIHATVGFVVLDVMFESVVDRCIVCGSRSHNYRRKDSIADHSSISVLKIFIKCMKANSSNLPEHHVQYKVTYIPRTVKYKTA